MPRRTRSSRRPVRRGFVESGTVAIATILILGASSLATTARALDSAASIDGSTAASTEVTATPPTLLLPTAEPPLPLDAPPPPAPPTPSHDAPPPPPEGAPEGGAMIEGDVDEPPPNPRECSDARRQIRDQFRELNRFEKILRKQNLASDLDRLVAIRAKLKDFDRSFQRACTRDTLQEFWDMQVWEDINVFRCKAELPQQLTQMDREFQRLDRFATTKRLQLTGLQLDAFRANNARAKQAITDAKASLAAGSCEDTQEAMQVFWEEGLNPGEMMGVIGRLSDIGRQMQRVRDVTVREEFEAVLQPIIDMADAGDFREANHVLNDIFQSLQQLITKVIQSRRYRYAPQLEKLEARLQEKLGAEDVQRPPEERAPNLQPAG